MKTRLYIEGNAVDLGEGFAFPITRTFADMEDPTAMVVDYSKSVTLPRTAKNDQLFGSGGRLDFAQYGDWGVGVAFSPFKLLAVVLEYGGKVVFSGIGKLTSVTAEGYTLQIEGECGRLFRELGKLVFSKNTGAENRVTYWEFDNVVEKSMDNIYVSVTTDNYWNMWGTQNTLFNAWYNVLGFFLAYNGRGDFDKTNKALNVNNGVVYDLFDDVYAPSFKNSLKTFVGDGFAWYESKQIRPHHWGTYVYMINLWTVYANEVTKLGWKLNFDNTFFNEGNPYFCNAIRLEYKQGKSLGAGRADIKCNPVSIGEDIVGGVDASDPDTYDNGQFTFDGSSTDDTQKNVLDLGNSLVDLRQVEGVSKVAVELSADFDLASNGGGVYSNLEYITLTWKPTRYGRVRVGVAVLDYDTNDLVTTIEMPITSEKSLTLNDTAVDLSVLRTFTWSQLLRVDLQGGKRYKLVPQLKIARQDQLFELYVTGKYSYTGPLMPKPYFSEKAPVPTRLGAEVVSAKVAVVLGDYVSVSSILDGQKLQDIIFDYAKRFGLLWYADYENKELRVMTRATAVNEAKVIDGEGVVQSGWQYEPNALEGSDYYWTFDEGKGVKEKEYKDTYGVEYGGTRVVTGNEYKQGDVEVVKRGRTMIEGSNTARDYGATFGPSPSLEALVRDYQLPIFESGERLQERKFTEITGVLAFRDRNYRMEDYGETSPSYLFYAGVGDYNHFEDYDAIEILHNATYLHCVGAPVNNTLATVTRNWSWLPTIPLFGTGSGTWCGSFYAVPNELSGDVPSGSYNTIYGAYWKPWNEMVLMQGKLKAKILLKELPSGMQFVTYGGSKWLITKISDFDMNSDGVTCEMVRVKCALSGELEFSRGVKFNTTPNPYIYISTAKGSTTGLLYATLNVLEEINVLDIFYCTDGVVETFHSVTIDGVTIDRSLQTLTAGAHTIGFYCYVGKSFRRGVPLPLLVTDKGECVLSVQWQFN